MIKKRILMRRLACLLTTALVSMPITLNKSYAALAVTADATVIAGGDTITFDGAANDVLTITPVAAGLTFSGAVTTTNTSGNGSIVVLGIADSAPGVATFGAAVGTDALKLGSITVGTTALGGSASFGAAVFAETTIAILAGNVAAEVGTATFGGTVAALTSVSVGASATGTFGGIVTTPSLVVTGTANINAKNQAIAVTTLVTGGNIVIGKGLVSGDTVIVSTNQTPAPFENDGAIFFPANLTNGQTLTLFSDATADANGTLVATNATTAAQNNALSTYSAALATQAVVVTSTDKTASTTAGLLGVNINKATALLQARNAAAAANAAATDTSSIDAIFNALNARGGQSATADTNFTNQVAPQTDIVSGSVIASQAVTSGVQNVMSNRMASLRSGDGYTSGVVAGNGMSANSGFIQAFGSSVEQKNRGNEFGYDADTTGFAIGFDGKVSNASVIGISYARSEADVDGKGTGKSKNKIKTDGLSLYTDYATANGYVEASITYGQSDNDASRVITTAGLSNTYKANYDSEQYSLRISGGMPQDAGNGMFITPYAGATISQNKADAYTETSTTVGDALRLRIAQDTVDSQVGTLGIKVHKAFKNNGVVTTPEFKLAVSQEFGDDKITSTNTYQGGGASFKNSTDIEQTSGTIGLGVNVVSDAVTFNIGYEADVREKYLGHSAQAKLSAKF